MDLSSRLAHLSLAQIASMLNSKQQEVLLASISVAARFIQHLQAEEQQLQAEEQQFQSELVDNHNVDRQQDLHDGDGDLDDDGEEDEDDDDDDDQDQDQPLHLHIQPKHQQQRLQQQIQQSHEQKHHHQRLHHHQQQQHQIQNEDEEQQFLQQQHHNHHNNTTNTHDPDDSSFLSDDDMTPIKKFAEELKNRRKQIRLSQKGAAQSLRAFSGGREPCTDAIIYHFENLQMEPHKAMRLIPLLRDWLEWAEKHKMNGKPLPMMSAIAKVPRERKRKVVLFNEKAKQYLENAFLKNNHPDRYQLDVISQELNIPTRSIRKWFTNRRQRKRFAEKFSFIGPSE